MKIQKLAIQAFVALGPLGNLLTPSVFPAAFRFYYFILLAFPFFFTRFYEKQLKLLICCIPLLLYCIPSALSVEINKSSEEPFPLFRFFLLFFHFLFVVGASSFVTTIQEKYELITLYLKSFFISLGIGYIFYIGYYLNWISFPFIERFSVIGQFAYTFLRFSPGSYPNEYGTVASFVLSILTLLLLKPSDEIKLKKKSLIFFFALTFFALILTTTRAAYLSYFLSLLYLCWKTKRFFVPLCWSLILFLLILIFANYYEINLLELFLFAFNLADFKTGSLGERWSQWTVAFENFQDHIVFGTGFASITNLHNVYLQILFELGLLGAVVLVSTFFFRILYGPVRFLQQSPESLFSTIKILGLSHILWFAFSNHNLNHHLTWFVLFLFFIPVNKMKESECT